MTSYPCEARLHVSHQLTSNVTENVTSVNRNELFDTIRFFVSVDDTTSSHHSSSHGDNLLCRHQHHQPMNRSGSVSSDRRPCPTTESDARRSRRLSHLDVTSSVRWHSALIRLLLLGVDILLVLRRLIRLYIRLSIWRPPSQPRSSSPLPTPYSVAIYGAEEDKPTPIIGLTDLGVRDVSAASRSVEKRRGSVEQTPTERDLICKSLNGRLTIDGLNGKQSAAVQRQSESSSGPVDDQQMPGGGDFYQINYAVTSPVNFKPTMTTGLTRFYEVGRKQQTSNCCTPMCCCCCCCRCCCNMLTLTLGGSARRHRNSSSFSDGSSCSTAVVPRLVVMAAVLAGLFYARMMTSLVVADSGILRLLHGGAEPVVENGRHFDDLQRKYALDDVVLSTSNDVLHLQSFVEFFDNGN